MSTTPTPAPTETPVDKDAERLRAEIAAKDQENRELRAKLSRQPAAQPTQTVMPGNQPKTKKEIEAQLWSDPLPFIDTMARVATQEMINSEMGSAHDTLVSVAKTQARANLRSEAEKALFDKYEGEIEQMVKQNAPANFQRNVNVWTNAVNNVFGQHVAEITRDSRPSASIPRSTDGPAPPSAPSIRSASPESKLTDEQREMAHNLAPHVGWSHEEAESKYAHGLHIHNNQPGGKATDASAWDDVITTNNRFGKRNREVAPGGDK